MDGLVQMIFPFQGCILRFQPLIFQGVDELSVRMNIHFKQQKHTSQGQGGIFGWTKSSSLKTEHVILSQDYIVISINPPRLFQVFFWSFPMQHV